MGVVGAARRQHGRARVGHEVRLDRERYRAVRADGISRPRHDLRSAAGIPYRWQPDWSIDAIMPGGTVRFKTLDHFIAAVPHAGEAADNLRRERVKRAVEKLRQAKASATEF